MATKNVNVKLAMTRDRILVKRLQRKLGQSGTLVAPGDPKDEHIPLGRVVQTGMGIMQDGKLDPVGVYLPGDEGLGYYKRPLQPGDTIFYLHAGSVRLELAGETFFVIHEPSVVGLAEIEESRIVTP